MTRKVIRKRVRYEKDGVQVAADVDAVISSNVGKRGTTTSVRSTQRVIETTNNDEERADEEGG